MVQELPKRMLEAAEIAYVTWAGASSFAPFLSTPEASTEDPSLLTTGAFNKCPSHKPSTCNGYTASVRRRSALRRNISIFSY